MSKAAQSWTPLNAQKMIAAAFEWLWKDNMKQRKAGHDFRGSTYYLTASDVERQVRVFAEETVKGLPLGSTGRGYGYSSVRIRLLDVRPQFRLLDFVRLWLQTQHRNGKLEAHNFDRGHISGARYRMKGAPLYEGEQTTLKAKAERRANPKPAPVHAPRSAKDHGILCQAASNAGWNGRHRRRGVDDLSRVTCVRCLKLLKEKSS